MQKTEPAPLLDTGLATPKRQRICRPERSEGSLAFGSGRCGASFWLAASFFAIFERFPRHLCTSFLFLSSWRERLFSSRALGSYDEWTILPAVHCLFWRENGNGDEVKAEIVWQGCQRSGIFPLTLLEAVDDSHALLKFAG